MITMMRRQQIRITLKTALLSALFVFCILHARAQGGPAAAPPQTPAAQDPPATSAPTRTVKLQPLKARPGYIIGRAVFADGRPIPAFTVSAKTHIGYLGGQAGGLNGRYEMPIDDPNVINVTDIIAYAHITYQGQEYVLRTYPVDGKPDGLYPDRFVGNVKKGIVRDFVFHLSGIWPGHVTYPPPPNVTSNDSNLSSTVFEGCAISVLGGLPRDTPSTILITLTPTGPLIDGSQGAVIRRKIPNMTGGFYGLYDIPLGTYTATASEVASDGTQKPHKLTMRVIGTPITSGDAPLDSVSLTFLSDAGRATVNTPTLTVMP